MNLEVYQALQNCIDGDPANVKKGEASLAAWETNSGFFYLLIEIFQNANVDVNLRWWVITRVMIESIA